MPQLRAFLLAAGSMLAATISAHATILLPFSLTGSSPTYHRVSSFEQGTTPSLSIQSGTVYQAIPFTLSTESDITLSLLQEDGAELNNWDVDTFLTLYSTFDPTDATSGAIMANDDSGGTLLSKIETSSPLAAGNYTIVVTAFDVDSYTGGGEGDASPLPWSGSIALNTTAIPEPSTYALLAGILTLGFAAWHRRRV